MVDGPTWFLEGRGIKVPDRPGSHHHRWTVRTQVPWRCWHLGVITDLMPASLRHQDIKVVMAYRSRGSRLASGPWGRLVPDAKPSMSTMGHGPVRSMPRMTPRHQDQWVPRDRGTSGTRAGRPPRRQYLQVHQGPRHLAQVVGRCGLVPSGRLTIGHMVYWCDRSPGKLRRPARSRHGALRNRASDGPPGIAREQGRGANRGVRRPAGSRT
jgi:hypothetical protein